MDFELPQPKHQLTFYDDFGQCLTVADMVGGHTFVRSTVAQFNVGYQQLTILCGLCSWRQAHPAPPAPFKVNGMSAVGKALQAQGISGLEPNLVGQAGGVRGTCMKEKTITVIMSSDNLDVQYVFIIYVVDSLSTSICVYASL